MSPRKNTALIIVAAGNSSRLGQPKQQLRFGGRSLLERAVQAGMDSPCQSTLVVLGAYHEEILRHSDLKSALVLVHQDWEKGMGSSIKAGLKELLKKENPDQIITMLCDQPFVDGKLLTQLINKQQETGKGIIACTYGDTVGVPVLFDRRYFPLLLEMEDAEGAKKIIEKLPEALALVSFGKGTIDIDTADDYRRLVEKE
jgi:molybdenum cofactor cytidylyltransferase